MVPCFKTLKGSDKIRWHDEVFRKCCLDLKWKFTPLANMDSVGMEAANGYHDPEVEEATIEAIEEAANLGEEAVEHQVTNHANLTSPIAKGDQVTEGQVSLIKPSRKRPAESSAGPGPAPQVPKLHPMFMKAH